MPEKVFGIGLSRTGTTSLTEALRLLGYKSVHCPLSLVAFNGNGLVLSTRIVGRFDAFTDSPVARMYRELDEAFPHLRFILTIRPLDKWMDSLRRMRTSFVLLKALPKVRQLANDLCGTTSFADDRALERAFVNHSQGVREYFAERLDKDLLVLDVGAGDAWEKLCGFLGWRSHLGLFPTTATVFHNVCKYARLGPARLATHVTTQRHGPRSNGFESNATSSVCITHTAVDQY